MTSCRRLLIFWEFRCGCSLTTTIRPIFITYQGFRARVSIADGEVIDGKVPPTVARILKEWTALRHAELMRNWIACRTDGQVERIEGLDT